MTKDELKNEAEEKYDTKYGKRCENLWNGAIFSLGYLAGAEPREKRIEELEQENAILEKALNLYVDWADECGIAWDNFPDMTDKWYKKVEEKNLGWIAGLIFMVKEEAKEQLVKECENGK